MGDEGAARPGPVNDSSKALAAFGYPILIVAVLALVLEPYKDEAYVQYHAKQALGLHLALMVGYGTLFFIYFMLVLLPFFGPILALAIMPLFLLFPAVLIYQVVLAVQAYGGQYVEVPVVKDLVKRYAA